MIFVLKCIDIDSRGLGDHATPRIPFVWLYASGFDRFFSSPVCPQTDQAKSRHSGVIGAVGAILLAARRP
jgi:hypothetical protein